MACEIEHHVHRKKSVKLPELLVDTGSEFTWVSWETLKALGVTSEKKDVRFCMANGQIATRKVGFAVIRVNPRFTVDEVFFSEGGWRRMDRCLLQRLAGGR